jgi:dienelactone hydrolase
MGMPRLIAWTVALPSMVALSVLVAAPARAQTADILPDRITFPSADQHTTLDGYLYTPERDSRAPVPAVVMMHGRGGVYSTAARGRYDASTISQRHQMWGRFWAAQGFVAVLVDGFGPRGYPKGFARFTYDDRPSTVNEVTMRPLDAYGALAYLRTRPDVAADRIGLHGWSNGGSATLAAMALGMDFTPAPGQGFKAALAFYPACGLKGLFKDDGYRPYAPLRVFHGTDDEETSYRRCRALVERSRGLGSDIDITLYPDANHGFDDPGRNRQSNPANAQAKDDAMTRAQ